MTFKSNPLSEKQLSALNELVKEISADQIIWLNGFLEGKLSGIAGEDKKQNANSEVADISRQTRQQLTVLYGTETGKSKEIATKLAKKAAIGNIDTNVISMYDYDFKKLSGEKNLAIIVSTHGEGEPPPMAEDFHKFVTGKRLPKLANLNYSVLALGDKSYKMFCKTGEDIDLALQKSGATCIAPLVKCDVDFYANADNWINVLLLNLAPAGNDITRNEPETKTESEYSRRNPFQATILEKVKITGRGSDKEVYHLELSLEGSGLIYEPGDSLGIFTRNPEPLVDLILGQLNADPEQLVILDEINEPETEQKVTLRNAFKYHREITVLSYDLLRKYDEINPNPDLQKLLNDDKLLDEYLFGHDLHDLLTDFPYSGEATGLIGILRPLPPRLYSISSSQDKVGEEVHITVSVVRYERRNRKRNGACSSNLADCLEIDDVVPVFIEKNPAFKLPINGEKIIMIGAGTGIAPYRAFMQQREHNNISGNSWLFFGDRRFHSDFLYQIEWQKLLSSKFLGRMDVAFSRDRQEKIYVQHKLLENQQGIFRWLEEGAYLFLCGDKKNMAKDVNNTLLEIIAAQGGISTEKAAEYLKKLKREKRFQTDVY
jgi:sulfite reductase (NADPH) flavoprotein alpha-component